MQFGFTEPQEILRANLRKTVDRECSPRTLHQWEEKKHYPEAFYRRLAELGYYALLLPREHGGAALGPVEMAIVGEELGRKSFDLAAGYGLTMFLTENLVRHGSALQKERFLPRIRRGELRFSVAMTEPHAGSDAAAMTTKAKRTSQGYVLSGQKVFSTGAGLPGTMVHLYARTDTDTKNTNGISLFLLDPQTPGVTIRRMPMLGRDMLGTFEITLDDALVPEENLVGEVDQGWRVLRSGLELERMFVSSAYVGLAQTIMDETVSYAATRVQFGKPIGSNQAIAHALVDLQTRVDAARLLVYRAAWMTAEGKPSTIREVAMAKLFGSETLVEAARWGMQVFGGYGYSAESMMQLYLREAVSTTITGGTSQIQRNIIAQKMGLTVT